MTKRSQKTFGWGAALVGCALLMACGGEPDGGTEGDAALARRAYVVSLESDELTVIDLDRLSVIARVPTEGIANHMAEASADFGKVFVVSADTGEVIVVDARELRVTNRISAGRRPAHSSLKQDGRLLAITDEGDDAVVFIDPDTEVVVARVGGFYTPHAVRFAPDGRHAYVANLGAHHLSRIDLSTFEIDAHIPLDGFSGPPSATPAEDEAGFGDAQIAPDGRLYAAHAATGRVLVYDTVAQEKLPEIVVGARPWVVFADHPFANVPRRHLVPNFGDRTLSIIDGAAGSVVASLPGDEEAYGVNFTSQAPDRAFVMNRVRQDIAVVDTRAGEIVARLPVGGNTETASTTADGRYVLATVSSADQVVVVDAKTATVVKTLDGIGGYPWSITIPRGQNYCH